MFTFVVRYTMAGFLLSPSPFHTGGKLEAGEAF